MSRLPPPEKDDHELIKLLSAEEQRRADRFVLGRDRARFITRRAGLRRLLGDRLGIPPATIGLTRGPCGKPALSRPLDRSGLRFNVSHCDDLVLYALSCSSEIGVDIEAIRVTEEADSIASTVFSTCEYADYRGLPRDDKPLAFLTWWTRKEAFLKALGTGLSRPLNTCDVSLSRSTPAADDRSRAWRIHSFVPAPGFIAAVAQEGRV